MRGLEQRLPAALQLSLRPATGANARLCDPVSTHQHCPSGPPGPASSNNPARVVHARHDIGQLVAAGCSPPGAAWISAGHQRRPARTLGPAQQGEAGQGGCARAQNSDCQKHCSCLAAGCLVAHEGCFYVASLQRRPARVLGPASRKEPARVAAPTSRTTPAPHRYRLPSSACLRLLRLRSLHQANLMGLQRL